MHVTAASSSARARQSRMNRRRFQRRFPRIVGLIAGLYVLTMIVAPARTTLAAAPKVSVAAALPTAGLGRPAGEVTGRKKVYVFAEIGQTVWCRYRAERPAGDADALASHL